MDKVQQDVQAFHEKHGIPMNYQPTMLTPEAALLRASLIVEEASEFMAAARNRYLDDMVDALADILYVTYGAAVTMGVDMEPIVDLVHRSNMSKSGGKDLSGKVLKCETFRLPGIRRELRKQRGGKA